MESYGYVVALSSKLKTWLVLLIATGGIERLSTTTLAPAESLLVVPEENVPRKGRRKSNPKHEKTKAPL